jgi:pimeloyl-ACP methyl ester carboxylesterase
VALIAVVVPVAVYLWLNGRSILDQDTRPDPRHPGEVLECDGIRALWCWYDTYDVDDDAVAKRIGSFVLLLLPGAVYGALRREHETGFGRVVGNVWDVLTFWPRRFHPHAAPCSAERAVPELRARIGYVLARLDPDDEDGMVVVGHSQGSVLAAAAIASLPEDTAGVPSFVSYGSPIGTLYAPTWPAYVPPLAAKVRDRIDAAALPPWVNYWRRTDPVGAQVPAAVNRELSEPQTPDVSDLDEIRRLRPLERPTRWGTTAGHGHYLAEPAVQAAIRERRADGATA